MNTIYIGQAKHYWTQTFINNNLLGRFEDITVLTDIPGRLDWYKEHDVEVLDCSLGNRYDGLSDAERLTIRKAKWDDACNSLKSIDLLQVHYCSGIHMYGFRQLTSKARRSLMVYEGSDLLLKHEMEHRLKTLRSMSLLRVYLRAQVLPEQ